MHGGAVNAMSKQSKPGSPAKREFAFSRIAGASPGDYAAVSSAAVAAVVVALLGAGAVLLVWARVLTRGQPITVVDPTIALGLALPSVLALLLAALATYYITTSAGTLTGLKVAAGAAAIALSCGAAAVTLHLLVRSQRHTDINQVRLLARQLADCIAAGDYDRAYAQLDEEYCADVPLGYWRYEWQRFFDLRGSARKVELSDRTWVLPSGRLMTTMKIHLPAPPGAEAPDQPGERVVQVRLIYGQADMHEEGEAPASHEHPDQAGAQADQDPDRWFLVNLPGLITPLPPPYVQSLTWPAPGATVAVVLDRGGTVPGVLRVPAGSPLPTTRPDQQIEAVLATPPLVPPLMFERPWLTVRPPPPPPEHHH